MSPKNDPTSAQVLSIAEVERQTGIRPATLRMWERRYGFPRPLRDRNGDRVYPLNQVERLDAARRLIAQGVRPGKIFSDGAMLTTSGAPRLAVAPCALEGQFEPLFVLLRAYRFAELHRHFQQQLLEMGLRRFVIEFLAPLSTAVGLAWGHGALPVRCEHLYSQLAISILHAQQAAMRCGGSGQRPKVALATLTGEVHGLGIHMVEAVLATLGADCIQFGSDMPPLEVAAAARETGADIVALSFSASFPRKSALRAIRTLCTALPPGTVLWIGGAGAPQAGELGSGVRVFDRLAAIEPAVLGWRSRAAARTSPALLRQP